MGHVSALFGQVQSSSGRVGRKSREGERIHYFDAVDQALGHSDQIAEELGDSAAVHAVAASETEI